MSEWVSNESWEEQALDRAIYVRSIVLSLDQYLNTVALYGTLVYPCISVTQLRKFKKEHYTSFTHIKTTQTHFVKLALFPFRQEETLCKNFFKDVSLSKLFDLFPEQVAQSYNLRSNRQFPLVKCRTEHYRNRLLYLYIYIIIYIFIYFYFFYFYIFIFVVIVILYSNDNVIQLFIRIFAM